VWGDISATVGLLQGIEKEELLPVPKKRKAQLVGLEKTAYEQQVWGWS